MKLYIKQKVFTMKDKFEVADENGDARYRVAGEFISVGKKLHISDTMGNELALVQQKLMSVMPKFLVHINGQEVATIEKEFTVFKPKYKISGPDWDVEGNYNAHDYRISENGVPIVTLRKKWISWGDSFELDISEGANEILAVAVVLAIDCVMDAASTNR